MKYTKHLFGALLLAFAATSCVDNDPLAFDVQQPANLGSLEYLKDYEPLKTYKANPDMKLGAAIDAKDYSSQKLTYRLVNSNFDEVTAGNAMKYSSVVDNNGKMDFGTVKSFVTAAKDAGTTIYGHTLAWHSQQNNKYLNGIIADRIDENYVPELIPVTKVGERTCILVQSGDMEEAAWDTQFWLIFPGKTFKEGDSWSVKMNVMAEKAASSGTQVHKGAGDYLHWAAIGTVEFTTEWKEYSATGSFDGSMAGGYSIAFNLNDFSEANKYYFDDISFMVNGEEWIVNGNLDDPEGTENFVTKEKRGDIVPSRIVDSYEYTVMEEKPSIEEVERTCVMVESDNMVEYAWDTQFWLVFEGITFKTGDSWSVSMDVRADKEASSDTQTHTSPGNYIHWAGIGTINYTTEWETYTSSGTISAEQNGGYSIAFNLNAFGEANRYYYDNISFKLNGEELIANGNCDDPTGTANFVAKEKRGATVPARIIDKYTVEKVGGGVIPLTPEEKADTLKWAMENWIKGMMEATEGYVTTWDAVNEPISGQGGQYYDLWSADNGDPANNFYWQDYLGDEEYVRFVVAKAREYYQGTEPLKLFINDYNLESWWDGNKKLKSLIHWIETWEADGVTQIDGIGTQMHVSFHGNPDTQKAQEEAIINMFNLMAETGKLVKISELDMGYTDASGTSLKTNQVTEDQQMQMAEFYKFIISNYLSIIPEAQQYGITQWCLTDAPTSSGWRGGEPVGIWTEGYQRKHIYASFAEALAGE